MTHKIITYFIATVWLINGLICKILHLVPRHQQIVARILGNSHSDAITVVIGVLEILMAIWILSGIRSRLNAMVQILVIVAMNILEFMLAPDLLLFGRVNLLIALFFIALIYYREFILNNKTAYASIP